MYKQVRKRYMTLLEVMIAMALLSGLLVIVFGFFGELSILNRYTKDSLQASFQKRYVEARLSDVFSHLVNENHTGKKFYFFTLKDEASPFPSLVFSFNNGSVLDPHVASDVLGRLFVDQDKRLCLAVWPLKEEQGDWRSHAKIECLLEHVEHLSFYFLAAPQVEKTIEKKEQKEPLWGQWQTEWLKEFEEMPIIVKIDLNPSTSIETKLTAENSSKVFSYVLPSSKHPMRFGVKS
jgi:hypothetical protein